MSIQRHMLTARILVVGLAAGLCFMTQSPSLSAQEVDLPGPVESAAKPATIDNPVPRRLSVQSAPEGASNLLRRASLEGYSGAVLMKVTIDATGRVAETRAIGLALSGRNPSTHRVFQEDPLPSAEQMFAPDEAMARAALDLMTFARQSTRLRQYQPPADGPLSFYEVVVSTAAGRLTTATSLGPFDLQEIFPPSAVTSNESPRFATTGASAPVAVSWMRWDPSTGSPTAATPAAGPGQASSTAQTATSAAPSRSSASQTTGGAAGPSAAGIAAGTSSPTVAAPPPPPRQPLSTGAQPPVRVGGNIPQPTKTKDVKPAYPAIAQSARVQGIVIVETTISAAGKVVDARILRSIPLLDGAALEAVKQWEFTPTLLNGQPTAIIMSVTVNFTLDSGQPAPPPVQ